jgi:hypothetical protein
MVVRVSDWLHRVSTAWVAAPALAIFILFMIFVLPQQAAESPSAGLEAGSPDSSLWYTPAELYRMAEAYGDAGRQAYVRERFTFDLVWPLVYGIFLAAAISWFSRQAFAGASLWQRANLAPVLGVLLDFLENVSSSLVMARYPQRTPVVDLLAPVFTLTKWAFVGGSFLLLALVATVSVWRWVRRP